MNHKTATRIEPGETTDLDKRVYLAETWDKTRPCTEQCDMASGERCNGFCFRWANTDEVVFRYILPLAAAGKATLVHTTDLIGEKLARKDAEKRLRYNERMRRYYHEVVKKKGASDRERGTGSVYKHGLKWVAQAYHEGNTIRYISSDKAEVEAWIDELNKKKAALKELERMKKS